MATPVPTAPRSNSRERRPQISGSSYLFSVRTPLSSGAMIVKRVRPRGPERGASGCSSMPPADGGAGSAVALAPEPPKASAAITPASTARARSPCRTQPNPARRVVPCITLQGVWRTLPPGLTTTGPTQRVLYALIQESSIRPGLGSCP